MLTIVKKVTKKVDHPTQVDAKGESVLVKREAEVTLNFVDPTTENWLEDALVICGGDANLVAKVFNNGLWRVAQQWETNKLGKTDEASKGIARAITGIVATGAMDAAAARTMLLANPDLAAKLAGAKFEQFVKITIDDFAAYQLSDPDEKGIRVSRYPDVTSVAEEEEETEVKTAE
jgi:hypothetical protein